LSKWLIDEQLPTRLWRVFKSYEIEAESVSYAGFSGLLNGRLVAAMAKAGYSVLVTQDYSFEKEDGANDPLVRYPDLAIVYITIPKEDPDFYSMVFDALDTAVPAPIPGKAIRWPG